MSYSTGNGSSRRSLHLQPSASTPTLPPFRKLSQSSDIVNIFTPPMSQNRQSHAASNSSVWDSDSSRVKQSASASTVTSAGDSQEQRLSWDDGDGQASAGNTTPLPKEPRSQRHKRVGSCAGLGLCFFQTFSFEGPGVEWMMHGCSLRRDLLSCASFLRLGLILKSLHCLGVQAQGWPFLKHCCFADPWVKRCTATASVEIYSAVRAFCTLG